MLSFNTKRGRLADKRVRCALSMAIDREFIAKGSDYDAASTIAPPRLFLNEEALGPEVDGRAARETDRPGEGSAGCRWWLAGGFGTDRYRHETQLRADGTGRGIHVGADRRRRLGDADGSIRAQAVSEDRPTSTRYSSYGSRISPTPPIFHQLFEGETNVSHTYWENEEFDEKYALSLLEPDRRKREEHYLALEDIILDECPGTALVHPQYVLLVSNRVEHAGVDPLGAAPVLTVRLTPNWGHSAADQR